MIAQSIFTKQKAKQKLNLYKIIKLFISSGTSQKAIRIFEKQLELKFLNIFDFLSFNFSNNFSTNSLQLFRQIFLYFSIIYDNCADNSKSGNQKLNDELFQIWKSKFIKHEDAHAVMVNYEHRNERRLLKVKQQKDQVTEQTKFNQSQQLSSTQNSKVINPDTNKFQIRQSMQNLGNSNVLEIQETQAQSKPKKLIKYEYTAFENDQCEITAFRKQNLDTKKAHYDYVTQFPFQGLEDTTKIDSKQLNREDVLKQMLLKYSHSIQNAAPSDIIQENPFVFQMNQLKLQQMVGKDQNENGQEIELLRVEKNFSLFNKRNHYPYDVIQNPFKIQP